jgi:hypothetical protein
MAYDFLYDKSSSSQFCEVAYCFADWAIHNCNGYWDDNLEWHDGNYWPQYLILCDLLENNQLTPVEFNS